jgi:hypothetical protein
VELQGKTANLYKFLNYDPATAPVIEPPVDSACAQFNIKWTFAVYVLRWMVARDTTIDEYHKDRIRNHAPDIGVLAQIEDAFQYPYIAEFLISTFENEPFTLEWQKQRARALEQYMQSNDSVRLITWYAGLLDALHDDKAYDIEYDGLKEKFSSQMCLLYAVLPRHFTFIQHTNIH